MFALQVAPMKAFPTDEEIKNAGKSDAMSYLTWLSETDEHGYQALIQARSTPWGGTPQQPVHRCVDHLVTTMIRTIEADSRGKDDDNLTQAEVNDWLQQCGLVAKLNK